MSRGLRYFAYAGISLIAAVFIVASAFSGIVYVKDYARSLFIRGFNLYETPVVGATIISGKAYRKYRKTYSNIPDGMFHFANMLFYQRNRNTTLGELTLSAIEYTGYYKAYLMKQEIQGVNRINRGVINSAEPVLLDRSLPPYTADPGSGRDGNIRFTKGLYFSGDNAGGMTFLNRIPSLKASGINAVVVDVKDVTGIVHVKSRVKGVRDYCLDKNSAIDNLPMLIRECRANGIYVIARIAVFHDQLLWTSDPSSRIKSKSTGREWNPGSHEKWCDPGNRRVQDYNIALAAEIARAGVDEVQFDYIRFPTNGDQQDLMITQSEGMRERTEIITGFLKRAHREVSSEGAFLSIDIFGVVAWGKEIDIRTTGQDIGLLSAHCDVISPMLYPSHFNDHFDGFKNPGDHPYHFILEGCRKVKELAAGRAVIRPWLQAFGWRISNYNAAYINEQVRGSNDSGAHGYLFWNASNRYDEVFRAMGH